MGRRPLHTVIQDKQTQRYNSYYGVGICPRALERQTIILSICNVACSVRSNPEAVCNQVIILYSLSHTGINIHELNVGMPTRLQPAHLFHEYIGCH